MTTTKTLTESEWSEIHECLSPVMYVRVRDAIAELQATLQETAKQALASEGQAWENHERARLAAEAEVKRLRFYAAAFVAKVESMTPSLDAALAFQQNHGIKYDGGNWADEKTELQAILSTEPTPSPSSIDLVPQTQGDNNALNDKAALRLAENHLFNEDADELEDEEVNDICWALYRAQFRPEKDGD